MSDLPSELETQSVQLRGPTHNMSDNVLASLTVSCINKISLGYKPCQQTKTGRRFRDELCPHP
jgi:hypothetical protein